MTRKISPKPCKTLTAVSLPAVATKNGKKRSIKPKTTAMAIFESGPTAPTIAGPYF